MSSEDNTLYWTEKLNRLEEEILLLEIENHDLQ